MSRIEASQKKVSQYLEICCTRFAVKQNRETIEISTVSAF